MLVIELAPSSACPCGERFVFDNSFRLAWLAALACRGDHSGAERVGDVSVSVFGLFWTMSLSLGTRFPRHS
jgi:hypothetical protein